MASPATLHVFKSNHILDEDLFFGDEYKVNPRKGARYHVIRKRIYARFKGKLKNEDEDNDDEAQDEAEDGDVSESAEDWAGFVSPKADLSLPVKLKEKAGINKEATKFAFLHPPKDLANDIDWDQVNRDLEVFDDKFHDNPNSKDSAPANQANHEQRPCSWSCFPEINDPIDEEEEKGISGWALACFSVLGAFIYFDESDEIVGVKPLSLSSKGVRSPIDMSGPYPASPNIVTEMEELDRFQVIPLSQFYELGFVALAWVGPKEDGKSGYFLFRKEDGGAVRYVVGPKIKVDPEQDIDPLSDLIEPNKFDINLIRKQEFVFNPDYFCLSDAKSVSRAISKAHTQLISSDVINHSQFKNGRNIIHEGCSVVLNENDSEMFEELLNSPVFTGLLKEKDHFGLTPLHYACRFRGNDKELIESLIQAVNCVDNFGRYPLHLACAGNASTDIITYLIDECQNAVCESTKLLKRLPIHIALSNGASKDTIKALLDADEERKTILMSTNEGRLPLHISIEKKQSEEVIDLLIREDKTDSKESIYTTFDGMLPIHIACWNHHFCAAKLLVAEDPKWKMGRFVVGYKDAMDNDTHNALVQRIESNGVARPYSASSLDRSSVWQKMSIKLWTTEPNSDGLPVSPSSWDESASGHRISRKLWHRKSVDDPGLGMRALHLSLLRGCNEISKLLLREKRVFLDELNTIKLKDEEERTPLCLACMNNADEETIKLLLDIDISKETVMSSDKSKNTPLHYSCQSRFTSKITIQMLLDAEKKYLEKNKGQTGLTNKKNIHGMTPLYLAVKADADSSILAILMDESRINLKGFDESTINELSKRVKRNPILQRCINRSLASRYSCFILLYSLMSKAAAFVILLIAAERLVQLEDEPSGEAVAPWIILSLSVYWVVEVIASIFMYFSQGWRYFIRPLNWLVFAQVIVMANSLQFLRSNKYNEQGQGEEQLQGHNAYGFLIAIGVILAINIILALRSTFLPFAKFAGGLFVITLTLIPFVIISVVIIICFAFIFRMDYKFHSLNEDNNDDDLKEACLKSFGSCTLKVLEIFLAADVATTRSLDVLFGFIVVVILLTIVIAIVNDAWNAIGDEAAQMYWENRISFLANIQAVPQEVKKITPSFVTNIGNFFIEKIDERESVYFRQNNNFSWPTDSPYNEVSTKDEYDLPFEYLTPEKARQIHQGHSFESDLYWIRKDRIGNPLRFRLGVLVLTINRVLQMLFFICLIILGFVTFGFFWPKNFRRSILSYGYEGDINNESNGDDELGKMIIDVMGLSKETVEKMDMRSKLEIIRREIESHHTQGPSKGDIIEDDIQAPGIFDQALSNRSLGGRALNRRGLDQQPHSKQSLNSKRNVGFAFPGKKYN